MPENRGIRVPLNEPPSRGKSFIYAGLLWMMLGVAVVGFGYLVMPSVGFHALWLSLPFIFGLLVLLGGIWSVVRGV
jgi:hypothetical protein